MGLSPGGEADLRAEPASSSDKSIEEQVLRSARDFGSRLGCLLYASSLERSDTKKPSHLCEG
jgi:hypothetical protein